MQIVVAGFARIPTVWRLNSCEASYADPLPLSEMRSSDTRCVTQAVMSEDVADAWLHFTSGPAAEYSETSLSSSARLTGLVA